MKTPCLLRLLASATEQTLLPPEAEPPASAVAASGAFFPLSVADLAPSTQWYTEKVCGEVQLALRNAEAEAGLFCFHCA